ncbi:short coiled-coil protein B isoform X1 [Notolabrus celidotus]|uniref:short coiled-coil protein B isoform X1 n=1 Tax=Notolabrus celidotus TaxID=1203425 RepID=UPI00148F6B80|nr:short coiled-coil protein B isoform X1 [Notolabrus celidotus]
MSSDDGDMENQAELEEKTRLINQVLELQHTLEDLSARVDAVKEENLKLKSENQVLGQYIENLMSASSVFQTTDTKSKRNRNAPTGFHMMTFRRRTWIGISASLCEDKTF